MIPSMHGVFNAGVFLEQCPRQAVPTSLQQTVRASGTLWIRMALGPVPNQFKTAYSSNGNFRMHRVSMFPEVTCAPAGELGDGAGPPAAGRCAA